MGDTGVDVPIIVGCGGKWHIMAGLRCDNGDQGEWEGESLALTTCENEEGRHESDETRMMRHASPLPHRRSTPPLISTTIVNAPQHSLAYKQYP